MRSLLRKFRAFVSKQDSIQNDKSDTCAKPNSGETLPLQYFYLRSDEINCVELEILPPGQTIRLIGVDLSISCLDFTMKVSSLLGLIPGSHVLMIPNLNFAERDTSGRGKLVSPVWRRAPSSSRLSEWLRPVECSDENGDTSPVMHAVVLGSLRLVHRSCLKNSLKSGILETHIQNSFRFLNSAPSATLKSGRELLDELGTRVLVHLPANRKVVIRGHLNRPIFEAVAEVCSLRSLIPCHYRLQDPHSGNPLDPLLSFATQQVTEFELRECDPALSNLTCLVNAADSIQWHTSDPESGLYLIVKPRVSRAAAGTSTLLHHSSSATESRIYSRVMRPRSDQLSSLASSTLSLLKAPKTFDRYSCMETTYSGVSRSQTLCATHSKGRRKRPAPAPPVSSTRPQSSLVVPSAGVIASHSLHDLRTDPLQCSPLRSSSSCSNLNRHKAPPVAGSNILASDSVAVDASCLGGSLTNIQTTSQSAAPKMARSKSPIEYPPMGVLAVRAATLPFLTAKRDPPVPRTIRTLERFDLPDALQMKSVRFTPVHSDNPVALELIVTPPSEFITEAQDSCSTVVSARHHSEAVHCSPVENSSSSTSESDVIVVARGDVPSQESLTADLSKSIDPGKRAPAVAARPPKLVLAKRLSQLQSTSSSPRIAIDTADPVVFVSHPIRSQSFLNELTEAVAKMHPAKT